jgi:hypothetical protein
MPVRRYYDYTREELANLSQEQIKTLIDIEVAFNGIIPCTEPIKPSDITVPIAKTVEAYAVHGAYYLSKEDALTVAGLPTYRSNYDYSTGYDYQYLVPNSSDISTQKFYNEEDIQRYRMQLQAQKKTTAEYEADLKEWKKYSSQTENIYKEVHDAIENAYSYFRNRQRIVDEFSRLVAITQDAMATLKLVEHMYKANELNHEEFYLDAMEIIRATNLPKEENTNAE